MVITKRKKSRVTGKTKSKSSMTTRRTRRTRGTRGTKNKTLKMHSIGNVKGYCFSCKKKVYLNKNITMIQKKTENGRNITIICGKCKECLGKVCKIVANEKA